MVRYKEKELLRALEKLNKETSEILYSRRQKKSEVLFELFESAISFKPIKTIKIFFKGILSASRAKILEKRHYAKPGEIILPPLHDITESPPKIALYTCVTGDYDDIREPLYIPYNCDFYIISDRQKELPDNPKLKIIDSKQYYNNESAKLTHRYFKTHPHKIFNDYEYSIYIDGNIRMISDPTGFIQRIGPSGIAMHRHSLRKCLYDEAEVCILYKRGNVKDIKEQMKYYKEQGMPRHFGLFETGVIARRHNDISCVKLMESWWEQLLKFSVRDQLSFPYVLWKNDYNYSDIGLLGEDIRKDYIFSYSVKHKKD